MPSLDLGPVVGPQGEQGATGAQGIRGEQGLPGPNQVTNSTATPLTGVLTGNGSIVGVENIDAAPTPNSTGFATSGGTDKAIKGRVPVCGLGKSLLDNAYFLNPENQRGITSGTVPNNQYNIDRWRMSYGTAAGTWALASAGLTLTPGTNGDIRLIQIPQSWDSLTGKATTLSVLTSDGVLRYGTAIKPSSGVVAYFSESGIIGNCVASDIRIQTTVSCTIVATKLELGSEQTLCHNEGTDANPVWVLNEIPDYEYELYRCMTSTADSSDTYANKTLATAQEIAPVEDGATASQGYAIGKHFCRHGLTYRAKTAISAGDSFVVGTNCDLTSVADIMDYKYSLWTPKVSAASTLSDQTSDKQRCYYVASGHFLVINIAIKLVNSLSSGGEISILDNVASSFGVTPLSTAVISTVGVARQANSETYIRLVYSGGNLAIRNDSGTAVTNDKQIYGQIIIGII